MRFQWRKGTVKISVVIVSYNVRCYAEQCLNSLSRALSGIESEIFVVDNHSRDGSVGYLSKRFKSVTIIDCNHNLGFARANNIAIRRASGEYVLLINPDTFVCEETIAKAIDFMDSHPKAGGAGVKMYNPDGSLAPESRRGLPTPLTSFYKMSGLCSRFPKSRTFGRYYMGYLSWDEPVRIEVISGAFCLLRRTALDKVGLLDEDFFMYGEDIDLSYRLLKGGFENWYLPYPILHYKGESTHKTSFRYVHMFYQAMLIFFRKHYGRMSFCLSVPIKTAIYAKAAAALAKMASYNLRKSLGFINRKELDVRYLFVGGKSMTDRCRLVARRKGLVAEFYCSESEVPAECLEVARHYDSKALMCVVFDTDTFSYGKMLDAMSRIARPNVKLGTFSGKTKIIITPDKLIK